MLGSARRLLSADSDRIHRILGFERTKGPGRTAEQATREELSFLREGVEAALATLPPVIKRLERGLFHLETGFVVQHTQAFRVDPPAIDGRFVVRPVQRADSDHDTTGLAYARQLSYPHPDLSDVLDHLAGNDDVEPVVVDREVVLILGEICEQGALVRRSEVEGLPRDSRPAGDALVGARLRVGPDLKDPGSGLEVRLRVLFEEEATVPVHKSSFVLSTRSCVNKRLLACVVSARL